MLHALPGFWHPDDLLRELEFGLVLFRLYKDEEKTKEQKADMFRRLQLAELRRHPAETYARSTWQGFDGQNELQKASLGDRDTFFENQRQRGALKPTNVVAHERMAERPFLPWHKFDFEEFFDLGTHFYDLNMRVDGRGKQFPRAARTAARKSADLSRKVAKVQEKEREERARLAKLQQRNKKRRSR